MLRLRNLQSTALCYCLLVLTAGAWAQSVQVVDLNGHSQTVSASQIAAMPHTTVNVLDHDKPAQFDGVPLAAVLSAAGIALGDTLRGPRLVEVLQVEASDGYKAAFALAEVDPAFATRDIILADKRDGRPLDAKEGPLRIVAPGDKRPARWVRQVTTLRVTK